MPIVFFLAISLGGKWFLILLEKNYVANEKTQHTPRAQGLRKVGKAYAIFLFKGERAELFWEVGKHANISYFTEVKKVKKATSLPLHSISSMKTSL
jgi:hypothetical protein